MINSIVIVANLRIKLGFLRGYVLDQEEPLFSMRQNLIENY